VVAAPQKVSRINMIIELRFPDPEYAEAFTAYRNYFEDLAGYVGGNYGLAESLAAGVHAAVFESEQVQKINRSTLTPERRAALDRALRKSWGALRRADREVEAEDVFDEEANAWLPVMAYYALYHALVAFAVASNQPIPHDHSAALKLAGQSVVRRLPYPWSAECRGGPDDYSTWRGLPDEPARVHALSRPDPTTSVDRLAMFLRTTRGKELERRYGEARRRNVQPGHKRRNVSLTEKRSIAKNTPPTTIFSIFWRLRLKASYDDADAFVLGASSELDALRLANGLVIVADATVAAIEALIAAYVGVPEVRKLVSAYAARCGASEGSAIHRRASAWASR
jgi:hypothetical protein